MGELRDRYNRYMVLRGFSRKTIEGYEHAIVDLVRVYRRSPDQITNEEIHQHLCNLIRVRNLAWSTINVRFSSYRLFYQKVLGWKEVRFSIPERGRSHKRPHVLDRQSVQKILGSCSNLKHKTLLTMVYGSGLRVGEVVLLRSRHIESAPDRMLVRVENGKGHKDRYTLLSRQALELLRKYWKAYRPLDWLFFGFDRQKHMSIGTAQRIYTQACEKAGIQESHGIHTLRHCFATHLLESGVDLHTIKRLMGHSALTTTACYCHVSQAHLQSVKSPADLLHDQ
jgi:integrase/recombinase XerD